MPKKYIRTGERRTAARYADAPELVATMKELVLSVKEVYAQNRALFTKLHNFMLDVEAQRKTNLALITKLAAALDADTVNREEATAIVRDFLRTEAAQIVRNPNTSHAH